MSDSYLQLREAGEAPSANRSLSTVFEDLSREFNQLIHHELQLAKQELHATAPVTGRASILLGGAAVAGFICLLFLSLAAAWALRLVMPLGWGLVTVAGGYGAATAFLLQRRRTELDEGDGH